MTAAIRLLGPVEAHIDGAPVDLGGPRQRRLAATLALRAGHRVGIGEIIDAVWPDGELPPRPNDTLYTYVHRLRRALGDQGIVETKEGTYRIVLSDDDVDALLFERMVNDCPAYDADRRIEQLRRALDLWRGPALSGFEHEEWARPHAVRLAEMRSLAIDDLGELLIAETRHDEAIVGLEAACAEQPIRERSHRLLMTALHLAGRKAEALRVYQTYRRRLATDLGLSPGETIADLERAITADELVRPVVAPASPPLAGYEIHEVIGEGAFARIFRGTQPSVGRDVAIKQIRGELADRPDFVRRFEAEAHIVARLEHPHIVPIHDFWREPGSAYIVMRWIRGGSLEQRLAAGPLTFDEARGIVLQIGGALSSAHRAGVVHRDVKPGNILLDELGNAYLTDFGIATDPERPTSTDAMLGSPAYAAPEQLSGDAASRRTDVHALATVLHELLTGRVPFGDSPNDVVLRSRQLTEPLPPIEGEVAGAPVGVDAVIGRATAKDPDCRYPSIDELLDALSSLDRRDESRIGSPAPSDRGDGGSNPYRGLRAFDEADSTFFHGRENITATIVERLGRRFHASFVALVGPSGSGKSSLARAGAIPALRGGAVLGSDRWYVTTMVPGADPFGEMARALRRIATNEIGGDLAARLSEDPSALIAALAETIDDPAGNVLLLIDQFEELFTQDIDDECVAAFVEALRVGVGSPNSPLRLIITLRADFYDRPLHYAGFADLLSDATVVVPPLAADELERAIRAPAEAAGVEFEPGLVAELIADVGTQPGALPLLQYALTELFDQRSDRTMTRERYHAIGRLTGAIAARADQIYATADAERQAATRRLMMRLVAIDDAGDARRRVHRAELGDDAATAAMIDAFGSARLLAFDRDPTDREPTVEVAHEALLREWPRLQRWLGEDRSGRRIHRQLTAAAKAWIDGGRDDGDLLRGLRLAATEAWAGRATDDLNPDERELLAASVARREADTAAETSRRAVLQRQNSKLRRLAVVAVTVALLAGIAGAVALQQRARAADRAFDTETARLASSAAQLATTNRRVALLLAAEAYRRDPNNESLGALQRVLTGTGSLLGYIGGDTKYDAVAWVSDDLLVAGNVNGIDVFGIDGSHRRHIAFPSVAVLAASPAAGLVAAGTIDSVVVIDPDQDASPTVVPLLDKVLSLAFSPDGTRLAAGTSDGSMILIDAHSGDEIARVSAHPEQTAGDLGEPDLGVDVLAHIPESAVRGTQAIAFAPDGATMITGGFGMARLWDATTGAGLGESLLVREVRRGGTRVSRVVAGGIAADFAIVGDRALAFVADRDLVWTFELDPFRQTDVRALPARDSFVAQGDLVSPVEVAGSTVFTASVAGSMTAVHLDGSSVTPDRHLHLVGPPFDLGIQPSGQVAAVAGADGLVLLSLRGDGLIAKATDRVSDGGESGVSLDGRVVGWANGTTYTAALWSFAGDRPRPIPIPGVEPFFVWMSPNGDRAIALDDRRGALLIDTADGTVIATLIADVTEGALPAMTDSLVAIVDGTGRVIVFDADDGTELQRFHELEQFDRGRDTDAINFLITFDAQGETLLGLAPRGGAARWNLATGQVDVPTAVAGINAGGFLVFTPDGRYAIVSYLDGIVIILDAQSLEQVGQIDTNKPGYGNGAAITEDGRYLVTTNGGHGQLWDFESKEPIGDVFPADDTWMASPSFNARWVTTGRDGRIVRWDLDIDRWDEITCHAAGRNLTQTEWDLFGARDSAYVATCPQYESLATGSEGNE